MQQLDYSLIDDKKTKIIILECNTPTPDEVCMAYRYRGKMFKDDETNDYINQQIKKALERLDEKFK